MKKNKGIIVIELMIVIAIVIMLLIFVPKITEYLDHDQKNNIFMKISP